MQNSKEIFELALGLKAPWYVKEVEFSRKEGSGRELRIHLDFVAGSKFVDDSGHACKVHDTHERKWRHLNFFEHDCYLVARVPRVINADGRVVTVDVPWARAGSGFTLMFEAYSMLMIESEMPVSKVGRMVGEEPHRIWTIFDYWIGVSYDEADHSGVKRLGIDETSSKKGHKYVTIGVDLDEARVVKAVEGKGIESVKEIADYLEGKGSPKGEVEQVCIDMSPAFIAGCLEHFGAASITFDRFHVVQELQKRMDELRQLERREFEVLKGMKYLFLTKDENLTERQIEEKYNTLELLPKLAEGYRLKEMFDLFWSLEDKEEAESFLTFWCDQVEDSKIFPLVKFVGTVKAHWKGIVNYTQTKVTNGLIEGINSKIQLAKRRARGYRNIQNFINMIYFICGKLKFRYPQYSS